MLFEIAGFRILCVKCFRGKCLKRLFKTVIIFTISLILITLVSLLVHLVHLQYFVRCSDIKGRNQITEMCRLYHTGDIVGSMCSTLCDENKTQYVQCAGNNNDKMAEILYCEDCVRKLTPNVKEVTESKVVLKSNVDMERWESNIPIYFFDTDSVEDKANKTLSKIAAQIRKIYQIDSSEDRYLLHFFIGSNYTNIIKSLDKSRADTMFKNVASLSVQEEFLAMEVFSRFSFTPRLYGTCGPAYLVEHTPPITFSNHVLFQGKVTEAIKLNQRQPSWTERANIALQLLDLIRDVENAFERPLHMCDAHPTNIGLNGAGRVVLPDLDALFFEHHIALPCKSDSDCDFFHCRGVCDINGTQWCSRKIKATNPQIICRKIFLSKTERFGLLRNPPIAVAEKLRTLLKRCAYTSPQLIRLPKDNYSDQEMMQQFKDILQSSLNRYNSTSSSE